MENTVQHDWFATRLMNGDKDVTNLIADDITPANSTLESPEFYKEKNKVKEIFTDDNGNFDDAKFNNFYNQMKLEYDYLKAIDTENYVYDIYQKSNADFTTEFGQARDREMTVSQVANPQEQKYGIEQWKTWSDPELSKREAAQKNHYYDTETGRWSDKTVNDLGALGLVFGDSLVYATWDEDGVHEDLMTGEMVKHSKGDWKTDEWGNYYAETAGNKDNLDKQSVTVSEVLTDDEGAWNTIDIFDSDDINQNIPKTIARAALTVAAMATPWGGIGKTISLITAAMQFASVMPQIGKTLTSFFNEDVEFDKLNSWDNYMRKFKRSTSDYSSAHAFSFESIMDMAISSFTQYAQQRAIAQIPQMFLGKSIEGAHATATVKELMKHNPEAQKFLLENPNVLAEVVKAGASYKQTKGLIEKAEKISTAVSRGYLIATATEDVYREAQQYGFDKQTASVISLATYLGTWGLFSTDYFRGLLYNGSDYETKKKIDILVKSYLKNNAAKMSKEVANASTETKKSIYKKWISGISSFIKNHIAEVNAGEFGIMAGAIGEGLEEISEEVAQDLAFQIGQGWNKIKTMYTGEEHLSEYAYTKTNPLLRYATAGFGGALGGAIFKTADRMMYNKAAYKNWKEMLGNNDMAMQELVYYVSQGKTNQILSSIDSFQKQAPLLSTENSIFDGKKTANVNETENEVLFNTFRKAITSLDTFINTNNLAIDQEAFGDIDLGRGVKAAIINSKNLQNSMFYDYQKRLNRLASLNGELEDLQAKNIPSLDDTAKADISKKISETQKMIQEELEGVRRLITAEDDTYLGKLLLETNDHLRGAFINDKNALANKYYSMDYDSLPDAYKKSVDTIYDRRIKSGSLELEYDKAWKLYSGLASDETLGNILKSIQGDYRPFNLDITPTADLYTARLDSEKGISNEDVVDELFKILKMKSNGQYSDAILRRIAFGLLGISKSSGIDIDSSDSAIIHSYAGNLLFEIEDVVNEYFMVAEDSYNEYVQSYQSGSEVSDDVKYIGYRYASLDTINAVKNLISSIDFEQFAIGPDENFDLVIQPSPINNLLQYIIDNKENFKDIDISLVSELLNKVKQLGKDFVISDENIAQLTDILDLVNVALSIVQSAYENYSSSLNGVPFGANNFMNSVYEEKGVGKAFTLLNKDQVTGWIIELNNLSSLIQDILDTGLANKKSIISEEKRLSLQYDLSKLIYIQEFLNTAPQYLKDAISLDLDNILTDIKTIQESEFVEVSAQYRNLLLSFERQFKKAWDEFDEKTQSDLIKNIAFFARRNSSGGHLYGDTSTLILDKPSFAGTDFYYYMAGIAVSNTDVVNTLYRSYYGTVKDKVPFDSQEAVIVNALRFLTRSEAFEPWLKPIQDDVTTSDNPAVKEIHVCHHIMKILCKGGTGKSSTIIPGIYTSYKAHNPATKWVFAANTDDQLTTLKTSVNDSSQTFALVNVLINDLKDSTKRAKYQDSIIVIDEATNVDIDTWRELDSIGKQLNITFIAVGDDTQVGKPKNIDLLAGYQTPSLSETFRATSDINRYNTRTWDQVDWEHGKLPKQDAHFMYYENDEIFNGIKFDSGELTVDYIKAFISKYVKDKSQRVLLFTDKDLLPNLPKEIVDACNITITNDYSRIQGAEWDYVLTDVDLDFDGNIDDFKVKHRQNYTIFSRAKAGVVSFKSMTYKIGNNTWKASSTLSTSKPIYTALTSDIVESFKQFKDAVHDLVKLNVPTKPQSVPPPAPVVISEPINSSIAQVSPAFVKQDENLGALNISAKDLPNIRATLYLLATETNEDRRKKLIKQLPTHLQNGEFMITFVDANTIEFATLGNVLRNGKDVKGIHPMLVYSIPIANGFEDIYLGMFHSPNNSETVKTTNATNIIWSLIDGMSKDEIKNARFKVNSNNTIISRSTNILSVQNNESKKELAFNYDNGLLVPEASTFTMVSTPVVYFAEGQDSPFSSTADILKKSDELRNALALLWKAIEGKKIPSELLPIFSDVIGFDRKNQKCRAKGVPYLNKKFISFVQLGGNNVANINTVQGLKKCSQEYLGQLIDRIAYVNLLTDILNNPQYTIEDVIRACENILSNRGIWNTSVVVYSPDTTSDPGDIAKILIYLQQNADDKYYDAAIIDQLNTLIGRLGLGYFKKENEKVKTFIDSLGEAVVTNLKKIWEDCWNGNIPQIGGKPYWLNDSIKNLIIAAYNGGFDIQRSNTWKYDKVRLKGHLYPKLLVKNSLPVINPTSNSAITVNGSFKVEGNKVIQPAQIYVYIDNTVTPETAKDLFVPVTVGTVNVNLEEDPFIDTAQNPAQIDIPKSRDLLKDLVIKFKGVSKKTIDARTIQQIDKLPDEAKLLLMQLQKPDNDPNINDSIVKQLKDLKLQTFGILMQTLHSLLGSDFSYDKNGNNITSKQPQNIDQVC